MSKHTPGPWLRSGNTIYALMHHSWNKGVETFRNRFSAYVQADKECGQQEEEANARLIAAAPELLESLQNIVRSAEINQAAINTFLLIDAREAISKATGEV